MAETITLGKVSVSPKGAYSSTTSYTFLDTVSHNGGSFLCLQNATGIEPGVSNSWQTYWMVIGQGINTVELSSPQAGKVTITATLSNGIQTSLTFDTSSIAAGSIGTTELADSSVTAEKIASGSVTNAKIVNGAVTRAKLAADAKVLAFTNKTIATSAWASNSTYSGFGFRASVACSGVTANFCPFVIFSPADAQSGKFAPVAVTYSGGVYIYASSKPTATVTIPTILCIPTQ